jgi:hypothetical protein
MTEYPPKLVQIFESDFGSVLTLSDGYSVQINIRPQRLDLALKEYQRLPLSELLASRSLGVFTANWQTSERDWNRIREVILKSPVAAAKLGHFPSIWGMFGLPAATVRELPQRVYGGLGHALFTSHPAQFREDPNRPFPWCRALLNAVGGWVFEVNVQFVLGQVEVVGEVLPGHFLE